MCDCSGWTIYFANHFLIGLILFTTVDDFDLILLMHFIAISREYIEYIEF